MPRATRWMKTSMAKRARRLAACQQFAEVGGDAGQAEHAGSTVEQVLHLRGGHALLVQQVQDHRRVQLAASRPHRQAVERREPHRGGDAAPGPQATERGAVAEMGDDHAPLGDPWRGLAARPRRCTRRTGRGSRSAGCPSWPRRTGWHRPAPPPAWCGGRPCRSRRPAAGPAPSPARCGSAPGCAAGAAAPAARAARAPPAAPASTRSGRSCVAPPWTTRCPSPASGRPSSRSRSQGSSAISASAGLFGAGQDRSGPATAAPAASFARNPGRTPMPSTWPSRKQWSPSNSENFNEEEPAFTTPTTPAMSLMPRLPLGGGREQARQGDGGEARGDAVRPAGEDDRARGRRARCRRCRPRRGS